MRGRRQVVGGAKMHSALQILAADELAAGPVARARLPRVMPLGFHGSWQPAR
ncbi:MAG: carotenoid oxygenase family protein [Myxococcales bacterium]|nr:carotenoid oxygenase family protein [Myxococcales bacterium]